MTPAERLLVGLGIAEPNDIDLDAIAWTQRAVVNYKPAIEAFRAVTVLPPDTPEHQHVIDLAWMAIGSLFYEMEQYQQAAEAYAKVDRSSPEFDTMLYELAWVYVRLGDKPGRYERREVQVLGREAGRWVLASGVAPEKGGCPVTIWYKTTPRA